MLNMQINTWFGGVGVGWMNYFTFIIIAVFISGLMVGRTPEFLGKKIEANEMKKIMTVYLLVDATPYESHETLGVYLTKEDALAAAEKFKSEDCNYYDEYIEFDILEVEIGGDPMYSFQRNSVMA